MSERTSTPAASNAPDNRPVQTNKAPRIGKSFSARNPLPIGIIGLAFIIALLVAAFNAESLPLIGGGTTYTAYFTDSANLKADNDVVIAGVKVGKVQSVGISGNKVKVTFTVKDGWVGDKSTVDIKLRTLLGAKYLSINSMGDKSQDPNQPIQIKFPDGTQRTTTPFDVYPAFTKLSRTVQSINTDNLAKAFNVLASDFSGTSTAVKPLLSGLSRLSNTIASRNAELQTLLDKANSVTGVLAARDQDLQQLFSDGNLLLQMLNQRRDQIHSLLINSQVLSSQLEGLVQDNQKTLGPLLDNLNRFEALLIQNQTSLDRGLALLGPFYRVFNNVIGNGHWFDNYIQNLSGPGVICLAIPGCQSNG